MESLSIQKGGMLPSLTTSSQYLVTIAPVAPP